VVVANTRIIVKTARRFFNIVVYLFLMLNTRLNAGNKKGRLFG
jgi:hypothetical protein